MSLELQLEKLNENLALLNRLLTNGVNPKVPPEQPKAEAPTEEPEQAEAEEPKAQTQRPSRAKPRAVPDRTEPQKTIGEKQDAEVKAKVQANAKAGEEASYDEPEEDNALTIQKQCLEIVAMDRVNNPPRIRKLLASFGGAALVREVNPKDHKKLADQLRKMKAHLVAQATAAPEEDEF